MSDAWNLALDPGASGVVAVETDQAAGSDITNFMSGQIKHGGHNFKFGGALVTASISGTAMTVIAVTSASSMSGRC